MSGEYIPVKANFMKLFSQVLLIFGKKMINTLGMSPFLKIKFLKCYRSTEDNSS